MLKRLFGLKAKQLFKRPLHYEEARKILEREDAATRRDLAKHPEARPEMLYYLADDESSEVRRHVARNQATPVQADKILAVDAADEVRCELARKIAKLLPDLDEDTQAQLREQTLEVFEMLAEDQLPKVRQIIAEEIKQADNIPKALVRRLAHDVELMVCGPILEYSPLLNSDDLREIIATTKVRGALTAIAKRRNLEADVSDDIAATLDIPAVAALLANSSAQIREETLDAIIDHAGNIEDWHQPIVLRPSLSIRAIQRISTFVASSLIDTMIRTHDLPETVTRELRDRVGHRIKEKEFVTEDDKEVRQQAKKLYEKGDVTDEYIVSMVHNGRRSLVMEIVALMADIPAPIVRHIIEIDHPHGITALAWRAGLSMRTAMVLQTDLAAVPPNKRLNARNGVDYPLSPTEMNWQLGYFLDRKSA